MKEKWEHDYTQGCPILKTEEPAHETIISSDITEHVLNVQTLSSVVVNCRSKRPSL